MNLTKDKGLWHKKSNLLCDYAYQIFLNEYKDRLELSQYTFIEFLKIRHTITINDEPLKDYYSLAKIELRKEKLKTINLLQNDTNRETII